MVGLGLSGRVLAQPATPPAPPMPSVPSAPSAPAPTKTPMALQAPGVPGGPDPRQGIARLERAGRPLGFGAVLRSDGRILTALSALGHGNFVQARFSDGTVLGVRVVASDRAWDLALVAPEGGHWTQGLRPSALEVPASGVQLRRFRGRGPRLEQGSVAVAGRQALIGRDGVVLDDALVLRAGFAEDELGSPLLDENGEVAAVLVQACAPGSTQSCQLSAFGAPVSALKQFLRKAPAREPLPAAWLGLRGVAAHEGSVAGVRVISVEPASPAALAGLRAEPGPRPSRQNDDAAGGGGDLIVAVNDVPVTTPEEMRDAINRVALARPSPKPAASPSAEPSAPAVRLLVYGSGKFRQASLALRPPRELPEAVSPASAPTSPARATRRAEPGPAVKPAAPTPPAAPPGGKDTAPSGASDKAP